MIVAFWILIGFVFYSYFGYTLFLQLWLFLKGKGNANLVNNYEPEVTLFIAAYNEKDIIEEKIKNTQSNPILYAH